MKSPKFLMLERNTARDTKLAQKPACETKKTVTAQLHTGETVTAVKWQWDGENRIFLLPRNYESLLTVLPFARDVIFAIGHIYLQQGCPANGKIKTTAREIAAVLGLQWKGILGRKIEDALTLARMLTIQNLDKRFRNKKVWYEKLDAYGFVNSWMRLNIQNGMALPENSQPILIQLSPEFAKALRNEFVIRIPLTALNAVREAPVRCRSAAKNILFYLTSLQPLECINISEAKLYDIAGLTIRKDKVPRTMAKCLQALEKTIVKKWQKQGDKYLIELYLPGVYCKSGF